MTPTEADIRERAVRRAYGRLYPTLHWDAASTIGRIEAEHALSADDVLAVVETEIALRATADPPDAWKQVHDLWETYCEDWEIRPDLTVTALGPDRSVRLSVGQSPKIRDPEHRGGYAVTDRNVGTMRELAAALIAACDFVDAANPTWAQIPEAVIRRTA